MNKIIAIDFDGTCVSHEYPLVGKDIGAIPVLKELMSNGHRLILFTMRSNKVDEDVSE
jgi:hydroxymethylpyrimidine pyrophosphatase-like HAD family hydrolase